MGKRGCSKRRKKRYMELESEKTVSKVDSVSITTTHRRSRVNPCTIYTVYLFIYYILLKLDSSLTLLDRIFLLFVRSFSFLRYSKTIHTHIHTHMFKRSHNNNNKKKKRNEVTNKFRWFHSLISLTQSYHLCDAIVLLYYRSCSSCRFTFL